MSMVNYFQQLAEFRHKQNAMDVELEVIEARLLSYDWIIVIEIDLMDEKQYQI